MDDMGGGMGLAGSKTSGRVDQGCHPIANGEIAVEMHLVDDQAWYRTLHVKNLKVDPVGANDARIRILATHLGIKRGLGQHDLDDGPRLSSRHGGTVSDDASNGGIDRQIGVAEEWGLTEGTNLRVSLPIREQALLRLRVSFSAGTLLSHEGGELVAINL